jgi:hypothetical protein
MRQVYSQEEYAYRARKMAILYLNGDENDKASLQLVSSDVRDTIYWNCESNLHNDWSVHQGP